MTVWVVLGHRLKPRNKMTRALARRLHHFAFKPHDRVMVCGGNACGGACTHSEAYVMRAYLVHARGIPPDRILLENRSMTTVQNLVRMARVCRAHRITRVTVITSDWHMPRVRAIWRTLRPSGVAARFSASRDTAKSWRAREERRKLRAWRRGGW